ncbi:MAG: hypothetical protein ABFS28_05675 [Bacteroidota bacterium]
MKKHILISFLLVISLSTCIDSYDLELDAYDSLLVVDGEFTAEKINDGNYFPAVYDKPHDF